VLLCCVSFWFWLEIGFGLLTHVLRVQYSCGVVLVFWLQGEIVFGVTFILSVQYSCVPPKQSTGMNVEPVSAKSELPPKQSARK
jgi:hypothetical protein